MATAASEAMVKAMATAEREAMATAALARPEDRGGGEMPLRPLPPGWCPIRRKIL